MIQPKIIIPFKLKITRIFKDGFEGVDAESEKLFKKKCFVKDNVCLKNNSYHEGDVVRIIIEIIDKEKLGKEITGKRFYCVINELTVEGFYTKTFDETESRFKRRFWYESRGMINFPNEKMSERFEVGDILKIEIKKNDNI